LNMLEARVGVKRQLEAGATGLFVAEGEQGVGAGGAEGGDETGGRGGGDEDCGDEGEDKWVAGGFVDVYGEKF
jgi:hypothetical protein